MDQKQSWPASFLEGYEGGVAPAEETLIKRVDVDLLSDHGHQALLVRSQMSETHRAGIEEAISSVRAIATSLGVDPNDLSVQEEINTLQNVLDSGYVWHVYVNCDKHGGKILDSGDEASARESFDRFVKITEEISAGGGGELPPEFN